MNENNKKYWVELSTSTGDLKVYGDRPWGAPSWISNAPFRLTKAQAWAQCKASLAADPKAIVNVYVDCRLVWSSIPGRLERERAAQEALK